MRNFFKSISKDDILFILFVLFFIAVIVVFMVAVQTKNTDLEIISGRLLFAGVPVVTVVCACK